MQRSITVIFLTLLCLLLLAACSQEMTPEDDAQLGGDDDLDGMVTSSGREPTPAGEVEYVEKEARVETVDVVILESFPVQARAIVRGNHSDGCTEIARFEESREGNTYRIRLYSRRPVDRECTEALVPYEESIGLDVRDMPAGEYLVDVNGISASFTLEIDNSLPQEPRTERCPRGEGDQALYTDEEAGFCLLFPGAFQVRDDEAPGVVGFYGPPKDDTIEPVRAILYVNYQEGVSNQGLAQIAAERAARSPENEIDIITEGVTLDGRPAAIIAGGGEMFTTIEIIAFEDGRIYALTAMPYGGTLPQAEEDFELVWNLALDSFRFIR